MRAFKDLNEPKYDISIPLGAFCWAWWEVKHAVAYETALEGRVDNGIAFTALREALVDRARRGDTEATQVLWDAADVRKPGEGYSLASVVESVNAPGVRAAALSVDDVELRSAAEALFAWMDEYERDPVSGEAVLAEESFDYAGFCPLPPVSELAAVEETLTIEEIRALTREEVESLTSEQLQGIDIKVAFDDGLLLRDFPLAIQYAWGEKSFVKLAMYMKDRCCYNLTVEELGESLSRLFETSSPFAGNENDPSTPLGAYCWSIWEVQRSHFLRSIGYYYAAIFDFYVAELRARVEMGMAGAADALRGVPAGAPPKEYPFVNALEAVDDPRVRGTAFGAEDPVLLEAVGVFYDLVDEYRRKENPSPHAFMGEFLSYMVPELASEASSRPEPDHQALEVFLRECKPSGEFA